MLRRDDVQCAQRLAELLALHQLLDVETRHIQVVGRQLAGAVEMIARLKLGFFGLLDAICGAKSLARPNCAVAIARRSGAES